MLSNYHTLRYAVSTLGSVLSGRTISALFSQEKDEVVIAFSELEQCLILSCHPGRNTLYMRSGFSRAKANSVNVLPHALNRRIVSSSLKGSDRLVQFKLESGFSLYARLYGTKANVFCVDGSGVVVDAFKHAKGFVGARFAEPDPRTPVYDAASLSDRLQGMGSDVTIALKALFPTLGSTAVREVLFRAGISSTSPASGLDSREMHSLSDALRSLLRDLEDPKARVYYRSWDDDEAIPTMFSIIPLRHAETLTERMFDDTSEAIREFVIGRRRAEGVQRTLAHVTHLIGKKVERAQRTLAAIRQELADGEREEQYRRAGTLILAQAHLLPKGSTSVVFDHETSTVEVRLDPALTPAQNAQRYFDKAKRTRLMRLQAHERISGLMDTVAKGTSLVSALRNIHTPQTLQQFMENSSDDLKVFGLTRRGKEEEQPPFRVFTVDGGFQVLAGKTSENNDLLTMKYAKPNDLWFHARGSSGSHVVLKAGTGRGTPSKKAKEQAAGIAAYYSKMRNAKTVPVAMTERKYVRKPRGAPPGTVTLERERVIFATPSLPPGR